MQYCCFVPQQYWDLHVEIFKSCHQDHRCLFKIFEYIFRYIILRAKMVDFKEIPVPEGSVTTRDYRLYIRMA